MEKYKTFSTNMYTFIKVDLEKNEVVQVGFGFPRLWRDTAKRGETLFMELLDDALYRMELTDVITLSEVARYDILLKESFKRVYERKLTDVNHYKVY